jgi:hypothetical protein
MQALDKLGEQHRAGLPQQERHGLDLLEMDMLVDSMLGQPKLMTGLLVTDKPALDMLVDSMPDQPKLMVDKSALDMLVESMPAQDRLVADMPAQDGLVVDKSALDKPAESMPAQPVLGLLHIKKLKNGEGEGCGKKEDNHNGKGEWVIWGLEKENRGAMSIIQGFYEKAETGEELRIGMDPLRGSVSDSERPDISGSIRSIKMYSYAQSTVQERLVCSGDVPCLPQEEQGSSPLHPEHLPPSLSAWGSGDSVYW